MQFLGSSRDLGPGGAGKPEPYWVTGLDKPPKLEARFFSLCRAGKVYTGSHLIFITGGDSQIHRTAHDGWVQIVFLYLIANR